MQTLLPSTLSQFGHIVVKSEIKLWMHMQLAALVAIELYLNQFQRHLTLRSLLHLCYSTLILVQC